MTLFFAIGMIAANGVAMRIWVTGAAGFLGKAVQRVCKLKGIPCIATSKDEVDISSFEQIDRFIQKHSQNPFTHIVNCAALAHVDLAEKNPESAFGVNVLGPENLGKAATQLKVPILHFSTEYIFNGGPSGVHFKEDDISQPIGVYASTKREGEIRLLDASSLACIVRTSWLFGGNGKTFLSSLFEKLKKEKTLQIAADQKGRPTYVEDLASAIFFFFSQQGILHYANLGEASRYEIALAMKECSIAAGIPISCSQIIPLESDAFFQINKRPSSCILDTSKIEQLQSNLLRSWKEAVKDLVLHSQSLTE